MDIAFKQNEIAEAMRQYVQARGFKLEGQSFNAAFSMGKGKNGLSVVVSIEDTAIPGYTGAPADGEEDKASAALPVVTSSTAEDTAEPGTVGAAITDNAKAVVETTAKADEEAKSTTSEAKEEPAPEVKPEKVAEPDVAAAGDEAGIFD